MDGVCRRFCWLVGLWCVFSLASVQAASLADQYEVAKTKILFHLSMRDFPSALQEAEQQRVAFESTEFDSEWRYWLGVSQSRNNAFAEAIQSFEQIESPLFANHRLEFELGIAYLQTDQIAQSRSAFQRWLSRQPKDVDGQYYLAFSYFPNQPKQAADVLRALDAQLQQAQTANSPTVTHDQVVYLLVASLLANGQVAEARAQSERLQNWPNGSVFDQASQDLLNQSSGRVQRVGWSFDVALVNTLDTNVALENEAISDVRHALSGAVAYRFSERFQVGYQGYYSLHWQSDDYNLGANQLFLGTTLPIRSTTLDLQYSYDHNLLNQQLWQTKHQLRSQFSSARVSWGAQTAIQQSPLMDDSSVWQLQPFVQYRWPSVFMTPVIRANVLFTVQEATVTSTLTTLRLDAQHPLANWQITPNVKWQWGQYDASQTRSALQQYSAGLSAQRTLLRNGYLGLSTDVILAIAEPDVYSYQRALASLTLGWRF